MPVSRLGLAVLLAGLPFLTAHAQVAPQPLGAASSAGGTIQPPSTTENIVVTGSRLATTDATSQDPVTIVTARQITQSSALTVEDVLKKLPSTGTANGTYSTDVNGGDGASCTDFHNLGASRVLVLLDGRRVVHTGTFGADCVDLNNIPAALIDRIEILKDGASSIYGADAVSGVINVILKHNYSGSQLELGGRITGDGDGRGWNIAGLHGFDIDQGRGNVTLSGSYVDQGAVPQSGRDWANPASYSNDPTSPLTYGTSILPQGHVYPSPNATGGGTPLDTYPDGATMLGGGAYRAYTPADNYESSRDRLLDNAERQANVTLEAHDDINDHLTPYVQVFYTHKQSDSQLYGQGVTGGYADNLPDSFIIPAGNPYNPFGEDVAEEKLLTDFGPRDYRTASDTYQFTIGFRGHLFGGWNYDASYSYGNSINTLRDHNEVNFQNLEREVGFRQTFDPNAPDPVDAGVYDPSVCLSQPGCALINPFGPNSISQAGIDYAKISTQAESQFQLRDLLINLTNNHVLALPYGRLGLALGLEHRGESGDYHPDPLVVSGVTLDNPQLPAGGGFNATEIYGEARIPILAHLPAARDVSATLSGRFSNYNTFGTAETWKAGLNWTPVRDIRFRTNIGTAFRQPGINELYGGQAYSFNGATDPCAQTSLYGAQAATVAANCAHQGLSPALLQNGVTVPTIEGGNPALLPETSRTYTIGTVITPRVLPDFITTIDYWHTSIERTISSLDTQTILDGCYTSAGLTSPYCALIAPRNGTLQLSTVTAINENLGVTRTNGLDIVTSYTFRLGPDDTLTLQNEFDKVFSYQQQNGPDTPFVDLAGLDPYPRIRDNATVTWGHGHFSLAYTMRYIDADGLYPVADYQPGNARVYQVNEVEYHDLLATWRFKTFDVVGGIDNIGDRTPPFFPQYSTNTDFDLYDVLGRLFYLKTRLRF